ncbi:MAG TPA: hypothetical protein VG347_21220 [Verrucomicrobiae bacterium]|nr:hypothetical protein [Verrucomicrobiae bacterium]
MEILASQFVQRLPGGMSYADAQLLCFWLFVTTDGIPESFHPQLTRQGLADMFAELAASGWVRPSSEPLPIVESRHWDGVITSWLLKKDPDIDEFGRGREIVNRFGFCCEKPSA